MDIYISGQRERQMERQRDLKIQQGRAGQTRKRDLSRKKRGTQTSTEIDVLRLESLRERGQETRKEMSRDRDSQKERKE